MPIRNVGELLSHRAPLINRLSSNEFLIPTRKASGEKAGSYYDILDVARGATKSEIVKAYLMAGMRFTPDKNPSKFAELSSAYNCLSNYEDRRLYDRGLIKSSFKVTPDLTSKYTKDFKSLYNKEKHNQFLHVQSIAPGEVRQRKYLFSRNDPNAERVATSEFYRSMVPESPNKMLAIFIVTAWWIGYGFYMNNERNKEIDYAQ